MLVDRCQWSSSSPDVAFVNADFFTWAPPEPFHLIFDYTYIYKSLINNSFLLVLHLLIMPSW
jgi:hypothetical protein